MEAWRRKERTAFIAKLVMYGSGVNLQQCALEFFLGIGFKFANVIQGVHRVLRFGQTRPVQIHLIHTEAERSVRAVLEGKWARHDEQMAIMTGLIREHGLASAALASALTRTLGVERVEVTGDGYRLILNDTVLETERLAREEPESVGLIVTSIPFGNQYAYTTSLHDLGYSENNAHFWQQMDYLTPNLYRVLQPGRICAIHVKDRITPSGLTGMGFQTVAPFHAEAIAHYTRHGFGYLGMKTITTDVVRENNQTYRLGWTEQCKDGSKMGVGMPEYVLLFRKPPTDRSNGYADVPVVKKKKWWQAGTDACAEGCPSWRDEECACGALERNAVGGHWDHPDGYSLGRWQIDAHGYARSDGNRALTSEELRELPHEQIYKLFKKFSLSTVYDYEAHVALCEEMTTHGRLPMTFMLMPPHSWHPDVWSDIARMRTLNMEQERKGREIHLCLARGSLVLTRERGYVPIEDVVVGERVLTHRGRWRPVVARQSTGRRPGIAIHAQGVPGLVLTPDHKIWARASGWVRGRDGAEWVEPAWIEAQHALAGYVNMKLPEMEPPSNVGIRHWWIVGRWLADGHWEVRGAAMISCGYHERHALLGVLGDRAGGVYDTGTALQVRVLDPDGTLKKTLRECGRGATGKHLPPEAVTLPIEQAAALLDGYLSGDGHLRVDRRRWMATSVSRPLLLGVAFLMQRVHSVIASVYRGRTARRNRIRGHEFNSKQEWVLSADLAGDRRKTPFILADGAWKKVRRLVNAGEVETYNLRVEEDESYTAEGCIVKNCPLQYDIVDRVIVQHSMPGEVVYDPFGGIFTVPYRALKLKRRAIACELSPGYFRDGVTYVEAAARQVDMPSLFDLIETDEEDHAP
jgi:DNA modification methylase